jgi:hypothetical protein
MFTTYVLSYGFTLKNASLIDLYLFDKTGIIVIGINVQKALLRKDKNGGLYNYFG